MAARRVDRWAVHQTTVPIPAVRMAPRDLCKHRRLLHNIPADQQICHDLHKEAAALVGGRHRARAPLQDRVMAEACTVDQAKEIAQEAR